MQCCCEYTREKEATRDYGWAIVARRAGASCRSHSKPNVLRAVQDVKADVLPHLAPVSQPDSDIAPVLCIRSRVRALDI
jgi:hypothetical protein